ncbi:hypothetical protein [Desulfomonile tiedjei]|uniref:Uncharacterized protein n=1 Tax=Desulfomonile tiedjei (strain ATCC 49306 / DSM 6799 / DCB-1) TaxID=706587 RepID=I4CBD0_DESTA|nr:hypothetical protein [Desulfomonile tiedjei]AFM26871.1 hypothetical protein Desti_4235 [Desulfomonile tiedjei DSM 6799]
MKLLRWALFTVIASLLPICFNLIYLRLSKVAPTLELLMSRGELLLVITAITATAAGELIPTSDKLAKTKMIVLAACSLVTLLSSVGFAFVSTTIAVQRDIDSAFVLNASGGLFLAALLAGGGSILLSGDSK